MLVDLRGSILGGDDHRGLAERVYRCSGARAAGRGDPGRKRSGFSSTGRASPLLLLLEQEEEEEKRCLSTRLSALQSLLGGY